MTTHPRSLSLCVRPRPFRNGEELSKRAEKIACDSPWAGVRQRVDIDGRASRECKWKGKEGKGSKTNLSGDLVFASFVVIPQRRTQARHADRFAGGVGGGFEAGLKIGAELRRLRRFRTRNAIEFKATMLQIVKKQAKLDRTRRNSAFARVRLSFAGPAPRFTVSRNSAESVCVMYLHRNLVFIASYGSPAAAAWRTPLRFLCWGHWPSPALVPFLLPDLSNRFLSFDQVQPGTGAFRAAPARAPFGVRTRVRRVLFPRCGGDPTVSGAKYRPWEADHPPTLQTE